MSASHPPKEICSCQKCQQFQLCEEGKCKVCKEELNIKKFRTTKGYIMGFGMSESNNELMKYAFDPCVECNQPSKIAFLRFTGNPKEKMIHKKELCTSCFIDSEHFDDDEITNNYYDMKSVHTKPTLEHFIYYINGKSVPKVPDLDLYPNHIITNIFFRPDLFTDSDPSKCTKKLNKREWEHTSLHPQHNHPPISGQYSA
jgi:hypothetical protein